jgi:hypothetical protein
VNAEGLELSEGVLQSGPALEDALHRFIDEGRTGIAFRAPSGIVPAALGGGRSRLPIVGCCVQTLRAAARRPPFERMAVLVAVQLETGRVRVAPAFADPTRGANLTLPPDPGEGFTGSLFRIDAGERLAIPPIPGPIALWLIARDIVAGPVRIRVEDRQPVDMEDAEVAKFLAGWRKRNIVKPRGADASTVWPRETVFGTYPIYRKTPESPPMPDRGIVLRVMPEVVHGKSAVRLILGSFRVTIPRRQVVFQPLSGDPTTAVVPITLVITGNDLPGAVVRHLRLPSYSAVNSVETNPIVEGQFKLNLFSFVSMRRAWQRYFVYAVCGDSISNPVRV